jgi:hypothetical protein
MSFAVRTRLLPLPPPRCLDRLVRATQHLDPTARQSSRMGLVCMGYVSRKLQSSLGYQRNVLASHITRKLTTIINPLQLCIRNV